MADPKNKPPYTKEEFMNAEQEMNKILIESSKKYKVSKQCDVCESLSNLTSSKQITIHGRKWGNENSVWPMQFGLACCAIELMDFGASRIDAERKGYLLFRATPRQCDVMIVAGWVTKSMAPRIKGFTSRCQAKLCYSIW
jgi:NADH:ubiquinone oxidoreductase subunit B-like Fe-S oxidoreductase